MKEKLYPALQLTDACNKRCKACLRIPGEQSHKIHLDDFSKYQEDLKTLDHTYRIEFQFVTGGEPTIWKDRDKDVGDILIALSNMGIVNGITMPTNGKRLENRDYAFDLVKRISSRVDKTIIVGLSIADYQENFIDGRCLPLENLLDAAKESQGKIMPIALVTLSRSDDMNKRIAARYPEVFQRITPLAPLGAGQDMMTDCPSVSLSDSSKDKLGDFLPQFKRDVKGKLKNNPTPFESTSNKDIMNGLSLFSHCGQSPFIDDRWHYCLPFRDNPEFDLAPLGEMKKDTLKHFISNHPWLASIRTRGLLETVDHYKETLSSGTRKKLKDFYQPGHQVSVAYRGCMICKELADMGVWEDIQKGVS